MKNPIQPLFIDDNGTIRFKANAIVRRLLDFSTERGYNLNDIAVDGFTEDDETQLAQLIGYSLGGFGELSYVSREDFMTAKAMHTSGISEDKARIAYLEAEIAHLRDALREPVARLYGIHPDDLSENR